MWVPLGSFWGVMDIRVGHKKKYFFVWSSLIFRLRGKPLKNTLWNIWVKVFDLLRNFLAHDVLIKMMRLIFWQKTWFLGICYLGKFWHNFWWLTYFLYEYEQNTSKQTFLYLLFFETRQKTRLKYQNYVKLRIWR